MFSPFIKHRTAFFLSGICIASVLFLYAQQKPYPTATYTAPAQNHIGCPGTITIKAPLFQIIPKQNIYFKTSFPDNYDRTPWQKTIKNSHQEIRCRCWAIRTGELPSATLVFQPMVSNTKTLFLTTIPPTQIQLRPSLKITEKLPHKETRPPTAATNVLLIIIAGITILLDIVLYFQCNPIWRIHKFRKKIIEISDDSPQFAEQLSSVLKKFTVGIPSSSSFYTILQHERYSKNKYNAPHLNAFLKQHALIHCFSLQKGDHRK